MPNVEKGNRIPTTAVPDGRAKPDQLGRAAEGARRQGHTRHRRPGHTVKKVAAHALADERRPRLVYLIRVHPRTARR
jgi:hypothetical protein